MKENIIKAAFTAALAAFAAYFGVLLIPVLILLIIMICDYLSGMAAAHVTESYSSRIGIIGIVKKVAYALIVIVSMVIDWVVQMTADKIGITFNDFGYFALLVIVWLIINECISILENVVELGVDLPPFLLKLAGKLKSVTEAKGAESLTGLDDGD